MFQTVLRLAPPFVYGGGKAYAVLSMAARQIEDGGNVEGSKEKLHALLRPRFPPVVAKALALKLLNILVARHHLMKRSSLLDSRPVGLIADPSNACRLSCPGCVHSERAESLKLFDWKGATLTVERLAALLRIYGPYAIGVYFCNYGEPLLNRNISSLIRLAKGYLLWTGLSTSLSVPRFDAEALIESGLDFIVVSIDGISQAVYQRFRRNGNLDLVLSNLRALVAAKRRLGSRTPAVSWNFIAFEHNVHEMEAAQRKARALGVDEFRAVKPFDVTWDDPEIRPAAVDGGVRVLRPFARLHRRFTVPARLEEETIETAYRREWTLSPDGARPASPTPPCHWLYKNLVMDARGDVMPCCAGPPADGSLRFARFDGEGDPFNSPRYQLARSLFTAPVDQPREVLACARCEWDRETVSIGAAEIRRYFRSADPALFGRRALRLLSAW